MSRDYNASCDHPRVRLATVCVLTILLTALTGAVASEAHTRVVIRGGLSYRPAEMSISGDGDFFVHDLRWRSWGGNWQLVG